MNFLFPFADVEKNSRIILYGAGAVGCQFYQQLQTSGYCRLVKWVDGQYEWFRYIDMPVESPASILNEAFDLIVVAVEREEVFLSVKDGLQHMNIDPDKILWKDNYRLPENTLVPSEINHAEEAKRAVEMNPHTLIDEKRMDIVVRYIYAKAFLENKGMDRVKKLYRKLIYAVNRGEEPLTNSSHAYFSDYTQKKGLEEFEKSFQELLISMKEKGFQKEYFIPLGADGKLLNGAHRLAAALALGINVWTVKFELLQGNKFFFEYTCEWLRENGFEEEEVDFIYRSMICIKNNIKN